MKICWEMDFAHKERRRRRRRRSSSTFSIRDPQAVNVIWVM
jgi:hypothetical protein